MRLPTVLMAFFVLLAVPLCRPVAAGSIAAGSDVALEAILARIAAARSSSDGT